MIESAELDAERVRGALREAGRLDLADRIWVHDGRPGARAPALLPVADREALYRAAWLVGLVGLVCKDCWVHQRYVIRDDGAPVCEHGRSERP